MWDRTIIGAAECPGNWVYNTVIIWIPGKSGIQIVDLCSDVKWSGIQMVVWKPDWKRPVYGQKCQVFEWSTKSHDFTIWKLDTPTVRYSDESGIQVFSIQMVIVTKCCVSQTFSIQGASVVLELWLGTLCSLSQSPKAVNCYFPVKTFLVLALDYAMWCTVGIWIAN